MAFQRFFCRGLLVLPAFLSGLSSSWAAPAYEFLSPPNIELNLMFRLDKTTGEVIACQFGLKNQGVGFTLCFSSGEGAGVQPAGEYGLVTTHHQKEGGIFRVNYRSGDMSICYVRNVKVVCTPQSSSTNIDANVPNVNTPVE